ncbi:MAG: cysteine desulfurase-like protein [Acidimicrobiales bacterium]|nr:cysteine desulfurase-like protein [Acidimicrobiales bacterium]MCB9394270.1 cysteine desulfurase-like protein [Acidimicrobiaceae bacterium]
MKHRFPGVADGWSRFDAPAGTQMVDQAIDAVAGWMRSPAMACSGGWFDASEATGELVGRARASVGRLFHADPAGVCFGPNMTSLTFAFSRAVAETLRPGDRVIGTRLDHEANVSPWRAACLASGADHVLAPFDAGSGTLPPELVVDLIDERTRWVTLPGASNLLGTAPDLAPIVDAAHAVGARVYVDAVALAPHRRIDVAALGCDAIVSSPYKWYGPHSGVLWVDPDLLDSLPVFKVRPAPDLGPGRFETGMPNYEAIAGVDAAARFLLDEGMDRVAEAEMEVFAPLLRGLQSIDGVTVYGPSGLQGRTPTAAFRVEGVGPADVAKALAAERIAVWDGHNYALEVVDTLGLGDQGGVVRAGLARYLDLDDVQRLLGVVERLAAWS